MAALQLKELPWYHWMWLQGAYEGGGWEFSGVMFTKVTLKRRDALPLNFFCKAMFDPSHLNPKESYIKRKDH